ncbi:Plastocyanin-like domain-containing protein [Plasmodiophora brassicae]
MASSPAPEHRGLLGARDGALLRVVAGDDDDDDDALLVADDQLRARSSLAAFVIITVSVVLVAGMFGAMLFVGRHQAIIDTFEDDDEDNFDVEPWPVLTTDVVVVELNRTIAGVRQRSYALSVSGPALRTISGQDCLVVDGSMFGTLSLAVTNALPGAQETILHAHGLNPASALDGTPYVGSVPIGAGRVRRSQYPVPAPFATMLLHAHLGFQAGLGASIPLLVDDGARADYPIRKHRINDAQDVVMFFQDFCIHPVLGNAPPYDLDGECDPQATLRALEANADGHQADTCMEPSGDLDVAFSAVLCNGRPIDEARRVPIAWGDAVRLRVVNGAGTTSFRVRFGVDVDVIALDGSLIHPLRRSDVWVAAGQRVDVLFTPAAATTTSMAIVGVAEGARVEPAGRNLMRYAAGIVLYDERLGAPPDDRIAVGPQDSPGWQDLDLERSAVAFRPLPRVAAPDRVVQLDLTGRHGFQSINGRSWRFYPHGRAPPNDNPDAIVVARGERVHLVVKNRTMHPHAMHLHGHTFQVVSIGGQAIDGPLRDTIVVPAGCVEVVLAFQADNPGVWAFHCHMEMHMAAGMVTTIEYREPERRAS